MYICDAKSGKKDCGEPEEGGEWRTFFAAIVGHRDRYYTITTIIIIVIAIILLL